MRDPERLMLVGASAQELGIRRVDRKCGRA
jgi:hypothetical protein